MKAFRRAVEERDLEALTRLLAPEVIFHSPVSFKPFQGREQVALVLATVAQVFEDFVYTGELSDGGAHSGLVFRTRIGQRQAQGIDLIELDAEGLIASLTVMIRPLSALTALAEAMRARLAP